MPVAAAAQANISSKCIVHQPLALLVQAWKDTLRMPQGQSALPWPTSNIGYISAFAPAPATTLTPATSRHTCRTRCRIQHTQGVIKHSHIPQHSHNPHRCRSYHASPTHLHSRGVPACCCSLYMHRGHGCADMRAQARCKVPRKRMSKGRTRWPAIAAIQNSAHRCGVNMHMW